MTGRSISVAPVNRVIVVGDVGPEERAQRVAPPRRLAEQLDEPLLLVGRVARRCGSMRIWHRSATACTGAPVGLGDPQPEHDRRHGGVRLRAGVEHLERRASRHRALARTRVEERVERLVRLAAAVEAAPQRAQLADQLVAGVDRHEEALAPSLAAVGADEERLDVGLERGRGRGCAATSSSHVSSGSSDSVAPAGLG